MKKFTYALGMILTLMLGFSTVSYAADTPTVTFDGSADLKYNYEDTSNFGMNFNDMMPGETKSQDIILQNTFDHTVDFYMKSEAIQAFEDLKSASGAAYQVKLTVTKGQEIQTIYGGSADNGGAWIGGDMSGLRDMNGNVTEWFMVATLAKGESAVITLNVMLDGETHTNDYQDAQGVFQFEFRASYDDPEVITKVVQEPDKVVSKEKAGTVVTRVKTGDMTVILPYVIAAAAAAFLIIVIIWRKKKQGQKYKIH